MKINFKEKEEEIKKALSDKAGNLGINEPVTLVDGFVNQPVQKELTNSFVVGGPSIPMVMLVGNKSGRVYYFALKVLLPDLDL